MAWFLDAVNVYRSNPPQIVHDHWACSSFLDCNVCFGKTTKNMGSRFHVYLRLGLSTLPVLLLQHWLRLLDLGAQKLAFYLQSVFVTLALKLLIRALFYVLQLVSLFREHALHEGLPESPVFVPANVAHFSHLLWSKFWVHGLILLKREIHDVEQTLPWVWSLLSLPLLTREG